MSAATPLLATLDALDRALDARPRLDGQAFAEATLAVCAYRDELRSALGAGTACVGDRQRLKDANLAVTLLMAGRFPLGETPWSLIEALRKRLVGMSAADG